MNGLDYAIIAIVALGAVYGLGRGVLRMATSILSLVLGVYAASLWCERAAAFMAREIGTGPTASAALSYILIFVLVFVAIEYAGGRLVQLAHIIHLNWIDGLGGAALGAAIAAVIAGIGILLLTATLQAHAPLLRNSQFAPRLLAYNEALAGYVPPQIKQFYITKRQELMRDWDSKKTNPALWPHTAKDAGST
jgi:uncharacterized membrane protein required for colicin V production